MILGIAFGGLTAVETDAEIDAWNAFAARPGDEQGGDGVLDRDRGAR